MDGGRHSGAGRIVATFYDLCREIWSGSAATESIQAGLKTVESLKTPVDKDIDPLKRASKENNDVELGEEEDLVMKLLLWSMQLLVLLLVQLLVFLLFSRMYHRHLHLFNIILVKAETSRGQTSREKMEKILENCRNKRI